MTATPPAMVQMIYLARLREAFATAGEALALPAGVDDVAALLDLLRARGGPWALELAQGRAFRVAVNHAVATPATRIAAADEVALFPPVTGG